MTSTHVPDHRTASVAWREWGPDAFATADTQGRPVLLSITANWCHGCAVMDQTTYADARVIDSIAASFVPVRIDADRRPDINDRYNLEGWPTTAILTAAGEILTGSTYLPPDAMLTMLQQAADAYSSRRSLLDERAAAQAAARRARPRQRPSGVEPDLFAPTWIARRVIEECDPQHGGFGAGGKFLHAPALRVALAEYERTSDPALARALTVTLDGMATGDIHDQIDGGFFRYASNADWSRPHTEKLLDDQAAVSIVFLEAARIFGRNDWSDIGLDTVRFVRSVLSHEAAAVFHPSQAADEAYYQVPRRSLRQTLTAPRVDLTTIVDVTARAAMAWMRASVLTGDSSLGEVGARSLEQIVTRTYHVGHGVAHWMDEKTVGIRGLLTDQVFVAAALIDLYEMTRTGTWATVADELMRTALRELWDDASGAFLDRVSDAGDIGQMADPLVRADLNAMAARVLARLSRLSGDPELQERALDVLRAVTGEYRRQGLFGAPYALAIAEVFRSF